MKKDYLERIEPLFVIMKEYKHSKRELNNAVSTGEK